MVEAIGHEIASGLAGDGHTIDDVVDLFASLAARDDTQYSYLNTLVAVDDDGTVTGACVAYDGARLHELRERFFEAVTARLGLDFSDVDDECDDGEYYLDTLMVLPEYRGKGIASQLLRGAIERASECGKPAGLLVDKINPLARKLYERVGFRKVGDRPFARVMMDHMQYSC